MANVRDRMKKLGVSQVTLILELQKRGLTVQPPEMSQILRGVNTYPKAKAVLKACNEVLDAIENAEKESEVM